MPTPVNPAVIGGSGLYAMPGLTEMREYDIDTHFGKPSAPIVVGRLENRSIAFLARQRGQLPRQHPRPQIPWRRDTEAEHALLIEKYLK
jgi:5'-methylthioadenosine phosphorylase